ncbi:MAG: cupredoxin domain-containing protein [Gammaproteobacteria bacterium]
MSRGSVVLSALLALAGCAELFPPFPTAKPTTTVSGSAAGSVSVSRTAAIAVYATKADGNPAGDVLVYAKPLDAGAVTGPADQAAVLDILERHFEPVVLPVRAGGTVTVQNLDDVPHDIYSFSAARPLSMHLDAGEHQANLKFSHPGVVTVGCKIYNEMQGYIYVTDAPYFGKTDSRGFLRLADLPPGRYQLGAWHVGVAERDLAGYPRPLTLKSGTEEVVRIRL